jgi:hypothetical protein
MHGLTVHSTRPLGNARPDVSGIEPDLVLEWSTSAAERLGGHRPVELLAGISEEDGRGYVVHRTADGYRMSFAGTLEVFVDRDLRRAVLDPWPGSEGVAEVLASGFLIAAMLMLRGSAVLHASAVEIDDVAVGLVGNSGMGKSTICTLLASAGARLISDDVLTVGPTRGGYSCRLGSTETRLREKAAELGQRVPGAGIRGTADARTAVAPLLATQDPVPLRLLLVPHPTRDALSVDLTRLSAAGALAQLVRYPRIPGWHGGKVPAQQFAHLGQLVRSVPVGVITVPWGPPFADDLGHQVLRAVLGELETL